MKAVLTGLLASCLLVFAVSAIAANGKVINKSSAMVSFATCNVPPRERPEPATIRIVDFPQTVSAKSRANYDIITASQGDAFCVSYGSCEYVFMITSDAGDFTVSANEVQPSHSDPVSISIQGEALCETEGNNLIIN
ncbi:MAG: hypothetical protein CMF50_02295 [Legionellales bacterium]|nr:hypothetical protein [Legionellales bacterium]|tara:strand:- start:17732 stop:18142 length:411 start_codon:yes stop_codon:yes gene_type:complete